MICLITLKYDVENVIIFKMGIKTLGKSAYNKNYPGKVFWITCSKYFHFLLSHVVVCYLKFQTFEKFHLNFWYIICKNCTVITCCKIIEKCSPQFCTTFYLSSNSIAISSFKLQKSNARVLPLIYIVISYRREMTSTSVEKICLGFKYNIYQIIYVCKSVI